MVASLPLAIAPGVAAVLRVGHGRVLLHRRHISRGWAHRSGHLEPGETIAAGSRKPVTGLYVAQWLLSGIGTGEEWEMPDVVELATPFLAVDVEVLDRNLGSLATRARAAGVVLRPHAKTHKTVEVARRQLAEGAQGLSVATLSEAEVFAAAGVDDLFIAYPLWVGAPRAARLRALAGSVSLRVGVDSLDGVRGLAGALAGVPVEVLVELDSGMGRSGVAPQGAGVVARAAVAAGLGVAGVFTFPGHSYRPGALVPAGVDEAAALAGGAAALEAVGVACGVRSGGSTPTVAAGGPGATGATELRPEVYVFNDAQQLELGTCGWGDVALTAVATVVSWGPGRLVLDAGSKVLGADRPGWVTGFGRLPGWPDARIELLSEHHAVVALDERPALPAVGEQVRVVPNHVCSAVNLVDELVATRGDEVVDRWPVAARGANT